MNLDVQDIYSTNDAFAAIKSDGTIVAWGDGRNGGDSSAVQDTGLEMEATCAPMHPMWNWPWTPVLFCFCRSIKLLLVHFRVVCILWWATPPFGEVSAAATISWIFKLPVMHQHILLFKHKPFKYDQYTLAPTWERAFSELFSSHQTTEESGDDNLKVPDFSPLSGAALSNSASRRRDVEMELCRVIDPMFVG